MAHATTTDKSPDKPDKSTTQAALNPRQRSFVAEYLKDKNATLAYMRAYGATKETAMRAGPRLMEHVGVKAEIDRHLSAVLETAKHEAGVTLERVIKELARIAFFDPRKLFDKDGNPLHITDLDDDTAAVIAGLDVMEEYEGSGADRVLKGYVKKWKLATKDGALDKLMKHLGGYAKDNEAKVDVAMTEKVAEPSNKMAREIAYALHLGLKAAANDPTKPAAAA